MIGRTIRQFVVQTGFAAALYGGVTATANGQTTIYSTFGPGDSHLLGGAVVSPSTWIASSFLFGGPSSMLLWDIRFGAWAYPNGGALDVEFLSGSTMGSASILESWAIPTGALFPGQIYSLTSAVEPQLTPGQTYWVMLSSGDGATNWNWDDNNLGIKGRSSASFDDGKTWSAPNAAFFGTDPAFDVSAIAVTPEPATLTLLATGMLGLIAARRRQRAR